MIQTNETYLDFPYQIIDIGLQEAVERRELAKHRDESSAVKFAENMLDDYHIACGELLRG